MSKIRRVIEIYPKQCGMCGDFRAKYMVIEAKPRLFQKDDVSYTLLCRECAEKLMEGTQ